MYSDFFFVQSYVSGDDSATKSSKRSRNSRLIAYCDLREAKKHVEIFHFYISIWTFRLFLFSSRALSFFFPLVAMFIEQTLLYSFFYLISIWNENLIKMFSVYVCICILSYNQGGRKFFRYQHGGVWVCFKWRMK